MHTFSAHVGNVRGDSRVENAEQLHKSFFPPAWPWRRVLYGEGMFCSVVAHECQSAEVKKIALAYLKCRRHARQPHEMLGIIFVLWLRLAYGY